LADTLFRCLFPIVLRAETLGRGGGETHACVNGSSLVHPRQACATAQVSEDDPTLGRFGSGQAGKFSNQKLIQQSTESPSRSRSGFCSNASSSRRRRRRRSVLSLTRKRLREAAQTMKNAGRDGPRSEKYRRSFGTLPPAAFAFGESALSCWSSAWGCLWLPTTFADYAEVSTKTTSCCRSNQVRPGEHRGRGGKMGSHKSQNGDAS
jgi:hypothetical protein